MEDTCQKECVFYEKYMNREKNTICPFAVQTTWLNEKDGQPKVVQDCAPKRSVIMQTEMFNRLLGLQIDYEEQRNKSAENTNVILKMAEAFSKSVKHMSEHLQVPYDEMVLIEDLTESEDENVEKRNEQDVSSSD